MANKRQVSIQIMKILHKLYEGAKMCATSPTNVEDSYIILLENEDLIERKVLGIIKPQIWVKNRNKYNHFYENGLINSNGIKYEEGLKKEFLAYKSFLEEYKIWSNNTEFTENDVKTLIEISNLMQYDGINTKSQFEEMSRRQIATWFEKGNGKSSKYLDTKEVLVQAFKKITGINDILGDDEKTQEYMFVVKCKLAQRKNIILFENLDRLRTPKLAQDNMIESWYAGGNNTPKLENWIHSVDVPIYYFCDWDRAGLTIYQRVKEMFIKQGKDIILITPKISLRKSVNSPNHDDSWTKGQNVTLTERYYSSEQINIISDLKDKAEWIEEEDHTKEYFIQILSIYGLL